MRSLIFAAVVSSTVLTTRATLAADGIQVPAANRPNIVFIITDDQSPESLSCYGNTVCQTPNIDRLAAEGMVLDDAHHMGAWLGAVCTCSRTMIMTGRTVWRIPGYKTHKGHQRGPVTTLEQREAAAYLSLPSVFNDAGYDTFRTCKMGNSFEEANRRFTVRKDASKRDGTPEGGSEWHGDQVIDYLQERAMSGAVDPFLIYFGFSHPHDPRYALPDLAAKYGASNDGPTGTVPENAPPLPTNWLPEHPFPHGHPNLRDEVAVQGVMTNRDPATVRNEKGREYACIENIDVQVGRLLEQLESMGELDNTYIFFTSDHGMSVGKHGLMGKQNLYEHTWKVPMIVRGPGIKSRSRASGYTYLLDTLPTLCDIAGIKPPSVVEGKSFLPVLRGQKKRVRDVLYGVYSGGTKPGMRAVKKDGWKLIEYDVLGGTVRKTQLFNLQNNPREFLAEHHAEDVVSVTGTRPKNDQTNLADKPEHAAKLTEMRALLKSEMVRLGDPHLLSE